MNRRPSPNIAVRLLVGTVIIVFAIVAFALYQAQHSATTSVGAILPSATGGSQSGSGTNIAIKPSATLAPTSTPTPPQFRLVSSKANLSALIIELYFAQNADNWDLTQLTNFAGHLEGTARLKQGGNFVLAGHVEMKDGSAGPFAEIDKLHIGDDISILSNRPGNPVVMSYIVTGIEHVKPDDIKVIRNHGYEELTLITCADWDPSDHTYHTRVVVHARPPIKGSA